MAAIHFPHSFLKAGICATNIIILVKKLCNAIPTETKMWIEQTESVNRV